MIMAPRIAQIAQLATLCRPKSAVPVASFVSIFLPVFQARSASILSSLSDTPGSYSKRIRRGRGPSSGKGKTSGRGHKGQKQHGSVPARFQGGQTPDVVVHGTRGFVNHFSVDMSPINLDRIQSWIDQGRLDPKQPITVKELADSRCLHGVKDGVKLLARGKEKLTSPINILVSRASEEAIKQIEAVGGTITTRFYTKQSIRRILKGDSISSSESLAYTPVAQGESSIPSAPSSQPFTYRLPDPTSRKDMEYYRDAAHRGYLSHLVEEGHGPSLFFKTPGTGIRRKAKKSSAVGDSADNKIW